MKKKKILIISYSYPPANDPAANRPYYFAKYLNKEKFDISVLTCSNQDSSLGFSDRKKLNDIKMVFIKSFNISKFRNKNESNIKDKSTKYQKFKIFVISRISKLIIPDKAIVWLPFVIIDVIFNTKKYKSDVIFSTSPHFTNHIIARFIKLFNRKSIIINDFRDYHYIENFEFDKGLKKYINKKLEHWIIGKSNAIVTISNSMKDIYRKRYKKYKNKFRTIYNGYETEKNIEKRNNFNYDLPLTIFYAGSFYKGLRDPMPLFKAMENLIKNKKIKKNDFKINIAGNIDNDLLNKIYSLNISDRINFLGLLSKDEIKQKYKKSHLLLLIIANKASHYTGVPIKFYEYFSSRRPILNIAPKEAEVCNIISKYNIGFNINSNDINIIENRIIEIFNIYKQKQLENFIYFNEIKEFQVENQTKQLENIINEELL